MHFLSLPTCFSRTVVGCLTGFLSALVVLSSASAATVDAAALQNELADHPSPYLALHGADPVSWQDWNEDTVALARDNDKLLFLSVGYFSCHWCHVMQRESYQSQPVADVINAKYIPVKIDRELHPALDARLMDFAVQLHGRGGWPLNVFLTPEGHPLAAVFYRPQENFLEILTKLDEAWQQDREQLRQLARQESEAPAGTALESASVGADEAASEPHETAKIERLAEMLATAIADISDPFNGGFGEGAKFPQAPQLEFLLRQYQKAPNAELEQFLLTTFDSMATRGLRDHIGGGFFRYTVDPGWDLPHFEKMLYGNAQLAQLYLRASQVFNDSRWQDVATDTLDFMIRDMQAESGAMVAAFSAIDAHDVEGGYYLWSRDYLSEILDETEMSLAEIAFSIEGSPPLPEGHLPHRKIAIDEIASRAGLEPAAAQKAVAELIKKLEKYRVARELPTDVKLLAGWNGLALDALSEAAAVTGEDRFRQAAQRIRDFLLERLWRDDELLRAEVDGRAIGAASVEDYAYVGRGLVRWAELTEQKEDWQLAHRVLEQGWQRFQREGGWYRAEISLIGAEAPQMALPDGSMPSPSAVIADATLQLIRSDHASSEIETSARDGLRDRAIVALNVDFGLLETNPFQFASYISALKKSNGR